MTIFFCYSTRSNDFICKIHATIHVDNDATMNMTRSKFAWDDIKHEKILTGK